ncbi:MAG: MBL fold metallo-hydrolase [Bacteroidaceae bacterium]|nr:MBL fold metallo-hydrolase [Bacteroidaceae bacterium]
MNRTLNIKRFVVNPLGENCYLVWDDSLECAIIDCGTWDTAKEEKIAQFIEESHLQPRLALQTHMHFDHVMGLPFLYRRYGLKPLCHRLEQAIYDDAPDMVHSLFQSDMPVTLVPVQRYLEDEEEVPFGQTTLRVIHTPGHTPGGLMFYHSADKVLFSGDTLFMGSVGRADFPGGDIEQEMHAIRTRVMVLPDDVVVYPGHGPSTTVGDERRTNPYL